MVAWLALAALLLAPGLASAHLAPGPKTRVRAVPVSRPPASGSLGPGDANRIRVLVHNYAGIASDLAVASIDPAGFGTSFTRDEAGCLTQITNAEGHVLMRAGYDTRGRVRTFEKNGEKSTFAYDPETRITVRTAEGGGTYQVHYEDHGRATEVRTPAGRTQDILDAKQNVQAEIDPVDRVTTYERDADGNPTMIRAESGETLFIDRQVIAGVSRPVRFRYPSGKEALIGCNTDGTIASYKPPDGDSFRLEYAGGRAVRAVSTDSTTGAEHEVRVTYTSQGLPGEYVAGKVGDAAGQVRYGLGHDEALIRPSSPTAAAKPRRWSSATPGACPPSSATPSATSPRSSTTAPRTPRP